MYVDLNSDIVNWCMVVWCVHRTCAEAAAVLRGTSHVTTKQRCNHLYWQIFRTRVKLQSLMQSNATTAQWVCSEAENSAIVAIAKRLGLISR